MLGLFDGVVGTFGVVMALSVLLQVRRMLHTGSARDVSLHMIVVLIVGSSLWSAYGVVHAAWVVTIANLTGVACNLIALAVALRLRRRAVVGPALVSPAAVGSAAGHAAVRTAARPRLNVVPAANPGRAAPPAGTRG